MYYSYKARKPFNTLVGLTLIEIINKGDELVFKTNDKREFTMLHDQDCCENVSLHEIVGDFEDLLNTPILSAEESRNSDDEPLSKDDLDYGSYTWTFYNLRTIKGSVTLRWYGSSNGYYSESVDFYEFPYNRTY